MKGINEAAKTVMNLEKYVDTSPYLADTSKGPRRFRSPKKNHRKEVFLQYCRKLLFLQMHSRLADFEISEK